MRPTGHFPDGRLRTKKDRVVTGESIGVQITCESLQKTCRPIASATLGEVVHRVGLLVSNVGPEVDLENFLAEPPKTVTGVSSVHITVD